MKATDGVQAIMGYCAAERKKVEIVNPEQITLESGKPAVRGTCPDCGAEISRLGALDDGSDTSPPEVASPAFPTQRDTKLTGVAGEHHVCSELARRGWVASLTRDGLERTDILVVKPEGDRRKLEVQVKTHVAPGNWRVGEKVMRRADAYPGEWFVMVELPEPGSQPRSWILPRAHLTAAAWIQAHLWLYDPTAKPGTRNTPPEQARVQPRTFPGYFDGWKLLDMNTDSVPVLLPTRLREGFEKYGTPPGHPWGSEGPPSPWTPVDEPPRPE